MCLILRANNLRCNIADHPQRAIFKTPLAGRPNELLHKFFRVF